MLRRNSLNRAIFWPSRVALYVGGAALIVMVGLTVADVVLRNLFSVVVPGGMEMTGLLTILVVLSTLSVAEIERSHIRVDLILRAVPEFVRVGMVAGGLQFTFAMMIVTSVQIFRQALYLKDNAIVTGLLRRARMAVRARRNSLHRAVRSGPAGQSCRVT